MDEANPPGNLPVERSESREGVKSDQEEKQEEMNLKDLSWIKAAKDKKSFEEIRCRDLNSGRETQGDDTR